MKQVATLFALVGSAAAFAPAQQAQRSSALAAKPFADALGAQAPVSPGSKSIFEKTEQISAVVGSDYQEWVHRCWNLFDQTELLLAKGEVASSLPSVGAVTVLHKKEF